MADDRIVVTSRGLSRIPEGEDGIPIEEVYPGETLPRNLRGAKFYETPQGLVFGKPLEGANDQSPDKPVRFPSRQDQIAQRDAEQWARLERDYDKVKITARPMRYFGPCVRPCPTPDATSRRPKSSASWSTGSN